MSDTRWALICAHRERLLVIARRRCWTREDAEDVVQDAMIRCAEFPNLDEERIGEFLTTTTMRLCVDHYRRTERTSRLVDRLGAYLGEVLGPEDAVCRAAERHRVRKLFASLPSRYRHVLLARARGRSVGDIAGELGITYPAAESLLSRARAAFRAALGGALAAAAVLSRRARTLAIVTVPTVALLIAGLGLGGLGSGTGDGNRSPRAAEPPTPTGPERDHGRASEAAVPGVGRRPPAGPPPAARPVPPPGDPADYELFRRSMPFGPDFVATIERDPNDPRAVAEYTTEQVAACARGRDVEVFLRVDPRETNPGDPDFSVWCGDR